MVNHPRRSKRTATASAALIHDHDHEYAGLLLSVHAAFSTAIVGRTHLFQTDAEGLNDLYLSGLPSDRQVHNCTACRHFIERFGGLVAIDAEGGAVPVMWHPEAPEFYRPSFTAMRDRVRKARVTSPFLTTQLVWGTPRTGTYHHISVTPPKALLWRGRLLTGNQAMAAARENFGTVARALSEYTSPVLDQALRLFEGDALSRSEKFVAPVKWLRELHDRPKGRAGENVLWRAIAAAPEGYCHPKSSVLGPLLDDIVAGLPFAAIQAKFTAMLHPLRYQRPQAAPTAGNIKQAEEIVAKLGIERSLHRRFARLDELQLSWRPRAAMAQPTEGVFGHLKPKSRPEVRGVDLPAQTMTWVKFSATVLPVAEQMKIMVPSSGRFIALLTAEHDDAPLVFKWPNQVSWYVYPGGSAASRWGLHAGTWSIVTGITPFPTMWGDKPQPHIGEGFVLVINGAVDTVTGQSNGLFPECLSGDLHSVRATIEAYSRRARIGGRETASACGYDIRKDGAACSLNVLTGGHWNRYNIDRWD